MIVLLTDFGESEYVGVMRGVIANLSPTSKILDLTHSIPPQSIREGAWVLAKNYKQFPKGSIFVAVVDPGVGTERAAVIVQTANYLFVGPDNGLLYPAVTDDGIADILEIEIEPSASKTFHGRDVFAHAGALIDAGKLGDLKVKSLSILDVRLEFYQSANEGEVVRIDRFGNIITNIPSDHAAKSEAITLESRLGTMRLPLVETYGLAPPEGLFLLVSSYDTFEIAAKNSAASDLLALKPGDRVLLE
jgi:S-adenosylmethionine hydrolase